MLDRSHIDCCVLTNFPWQVPAVLLSDAINYHNATSISPAPTLPICRPRSNSERQPSVSGTQQVVLLSNDTSHLPRFLEAHPENRLVLCKVRTRHRRSP